MVNKKQRIEYIKNTLEKYYPETPVPLIHTDPYTLLVSVLLSAQCTDERVNKITPQLWKLADNAKDMSLTDQEAILQIIRPCGLGPAKSKAIKNLSLIITQKHNGQVPKTFEELEALPEGYEPIEEVKVWI